MQIIGCCGCVTHAAIVAPCRPSCYDVGVAETEIRRSVSVRLLQTEVDRYQAMADDETEGNLSQMLRRLAAEALRHRERAVGDN